jgi:hypothetical protein
MARYLWIQAGPPQGNTMSSFVIHANTRGWMQERNPVNSKKVFFFIGLLTNTPHTEAVAEQGSGATRFYCTVHNFVYPIKDHCELCQGGTGDESSPLELQAPVTAL